MSVLDDLKGVRLIVTPQEMIKKGEPVPAVKIDGKAIVWDKGPGNGVISEEELEKILLNHGAEERE